MDSPKILKVLIKFLTDRGGVQEAQADLKKIESATASSTAKTVEDTAAKKQNSGASKEQSKSNDAGSGSMANFGATASKAARLTRGLSVVMGESGANSKVMGTGMLLLGGVANGLQGGLAGLATVIAGMAVSGLVWWKNKVDAAKTALNEFNKTQAETSRAVEEKRVEALAGQYDILRKSIDDAATAQERLNTATDAAAGAEKAAAMLDISLREKQALAKIKPGDEIGAATVKSQFANERRDTEARFKLEADAKEADRRARALDDANKKLHTFDMDIDSLTQNADDAQKAIRQVNEQLADVYGKGAPMKTVNVANEGQLRAGMYIPGKVVDEEAQKKLADALKLKLNGDDKHPGLNKNYETITADLAKARAEQERQANEVKARVIEADTAVKNRDADRKYVPAINAADTAEERKNIRALQDKKEIEDANKRLDESIKKAEAIAEEFRRQSEDFKDSDYKKYGSKVYRAAKKEDTDLEDKARLWSRYVEDLRKEKEGGARAEDMTPDQRAAYLSKIGRVSQGVDERVSGLADPAQPKASVPPPVSKSESPNLRERPSWFNPHNHYDGFQDSAINKATDGINQSTDLLSGAFEKLNAAIERQNQALKDVASRGKHPGG